jgi:ribosomal protein L13E
MHHIIPIVELHSGKQRKGRGFSPDELKEADLTAEQARQMAVRIDRKRKSCHEANVKTLQSHRPNAAKPKK